MGIVFGSAAQKCRTVLEYFRAKSVFSSHVDDRGCWTIARNPILSNCIYAAAFRTHCVSVRACTLTRASARLVLYASACVRGLAHVRIFSRAHLCVPCMFVQLRIGIN